MVSFSLVVWITPKRQAMDRASFAVRLGVASRPRGLLLAHALGHRSDSRPAECHFLPTERYPGGSQPSGSTWDFGLLVGLVEVSI